MYFLIAIFCTFPLQNTVVAAGADPPRKIAINFVFWAALLWCPSVLFFGNICTVIIVAILSDTIHLSSYRLFCLTCMQ